MSLQMYQAIYKSAQPHYDSVFIDPPCGDYKCRVFDAQYKEVQKNGNTYDIFSWILQIIDGDMSGLRFERKEFLPPKLDDSASKKLGFIKGAIERCGVCAPADIIDLPSAMRYCTGAEIEVSVVDSGYKDKEGKAIKNIKFMKLISKQIQADQQPIPSDPNEIPDFPETPKYRQIRDDEIPY